MPAPQNQSRTQNTSTSTPDPNALAGSTNSLGEESRRDGRPTTDDNVVEAIDEEGPEIPRPDPRKSDQ
jgi:hypothetical protein